jgi:hypothetical protein
MKSTGTEKAKIRFKHKIKRPPKNGGPLEISING